MICYDNVITTYCLFLQVIIVSVVVCDCDHFTGFMGCENSIRDQGTLCVGFRQEN